MKTYKLFSALAIFSVLQPVMSQNNQEVSPVLMVSKAPDKKFEITDCFNPKYYPESPKMFQWIHGTQYYTLLEDNVLNVYDAKSNTKANFNIGSKNELIEMFNNLVKANPNSTFKDAKLGGIPMLKWLKSFKQDNKYDIMMAYFQNKNHVFVFKITKEGEKITKTMEYITSISENIDALEIGDNFHYTAFRRELNMTSFMNIAWVSDNQIFVKNILNETIQITTDGGKGIVYGQSVHRNEFGIDKGLFWSPDGDHLAFYRMDERRVTDYPLFSIAERPAKPSTIKYPMAGDSSHTVTIGIYNVISKKTVYLNTVGPYDQYLTNVTWSPNGQFIYVAVVNREQNEMKLNQYSAETGELVKTLFTQKHSKYVEPQNGPLFVPKSYTDFIWQSNLEGFNHLYLYSNGKLSKITNGNWEVSEVIGFDKTGEYLIVNSTRNSDLKLDQESPTNRCPLAISWKNPKSSPIILFSNQGSSYVGMHGLSENLMSGYLASVFSNVTTPRQLLILDVNTYISDYVNRKKTIEQPRVIFSSKNPIEDFALGELKLDQLNNAGTILHTRTFLPPSFDPNKKYPVVVYLYGGPHAQMVTNSWLGGGNLWMHYMAQKGYIVFTVDNRGSSHRSFEFENATHRQLGTVEMEDQLFALKHLKSLPYVDSSRVGVHGWSFGGFMTTSLMTRHAGAYKVGVAGGPVIDWKLYEIMYTERYMDKPSENPEGYEANNLLNHASKLKGRLLMIHGADDDVVVWQHSLKFVQKSVGAMNANLDYYVYPGHKHNVVGPDRAHLYKKISQYFFDFL